MRPGAGGPATVRPVTAGPDPHPTHEAVREAVERAVREDVLPIGDLSASLVPPEVSAALAITARARGVVAGQRCVEETFARLAPRVTVHWLCAEGATVSVGDDVAHLCGPLRSALTAERTALNFLCHLSGVATLTRRFVDAVNAVNPQVRVLDTRKTTPGLRALEKAAVRAGGGHNHRGSLSEAVLLKDNHLGGLAIYDAVSAARQMWPGRAVEVECERLDQVVEACKAGATMVMLDNMAPADVARCVEAARSLSQSSGVLVEASGGVTLETAPAFAAAGVDLISVGGLTHSAPILDLGVDLRSPATDG